MMFSKPAVLATTALATFAAATPLVARTEPTCSSTEIKCCENVGTAAVVSSVLTPILASNGLGTLLSLLGLNAVVALVFGGVDVVLGLTCSGIDVGGSCNAQTVCCENVQFNGLINVGCVAIDIL
ncbi:hypothetical protein PC9H_002685 [Pleurotus ostreatus]|uniref:Hydrophobin n=2 Tax=Pleurotus TaxID=5320 RepID=A0A8H6ZJF9_PLEOS|nr:uncharacterized protein PC9H_002685 [Pleurotus ostreatus]KAF7416419.1 hypothetical protein PC9H_002685 [Pleurotus ostreatus]KAG9225327.1 hypothetical protein CCMSSC00406_0006286 [Pleurotus cornucopiae]KAJ8689334.1 hypothetical protein PTI98_013364 [Pleurotus ostreatus]